jgi:hypothetical protein
MACKGPNLQSPLALAKLLKVDVTQLISGRLTEDVNGVVLHSFAVSNGKGC